MKHPVAAGLLLIVGMACSYGWYWAPPEMRGDVWNILTSALVVFLLAIIALHFSSFEVFAVAGLLAGFKLMVAGCAIWFIVAPWPIQPGQAMCSARMNAPLGIIGLILAAALLTKLAVRDRHG